MSAQKHPPLDEFHYRDLPRPNDGILYIYRSDVDGFWHIDADEDIALQEATGYPVGELIEYEELGDYDDGEAGELRALFIGEEGHPVRYLKFDEKYIEPILAGEKTVTARYDFERELNAGEKVALCSAEDRHTLAVGRVEWVAEVSVAAYTGMGITDHHDYETTEECIEALSEYYPDANLGAFSDLTVIGFTCGGDL